MNPAEKQPETERTLNKRLKLISYILISFSAITLIWEFFPEEEEEFDELLMEMEEVSPLMTPILS